MDPLRYHRRSIRLKGYDYTQAGAYFITVCTQNRQCLFGEIVNGEMVLNDAGRMIQTAWNQIPEHHAGIETDAFIVMPNHIHGIIVITGANRSVGAGLVPAPGLVPALVPAPATGATTNGATTNGATTNGATTNGATTNGATTRVAPTLGDVVGAFKSRTTVEYVRGVATYSWPPFHKKLWQRNYFEHIIRNERALERIRDYILCNPMRWILDRENPRRTGADEFDTWLEHDSVIREEKPS